MLLCNVIIPAGKHRPQQSKEETREEEAGQNGSPVRRHEFSNDTLGEVFTPELTVNFGVARKVVDKFENGL